MTELWKDVVGYEGLYQVSNMGSVRSLNYANRGYAKKLVPKKNNRNRLWFDLRKDGKSHPCLAHRLVAMAFIENPDNLPEINHIDENPANNNVWNLEWCTREENLAKYCANHGKTRRPVRNYSPRYHKRSHLMVEQIDQDGNTVRVWANSRTIQAECGWSDWSISECCRGKRKKAYGYTWRYANDDIGGREVAQ